MSRREGPSLLRGAVEHYEDAVYYDHAYARRATDIAHYVALAEEVGGPVLELGVGTGRVTEALLAAGHTVVGVDVSRPMLERARARLAPYGSQVRLVEGDLRTLRLGRRFPLVIAPFNVFMHVYTHDDFARAMATVRAHLRPSGRFGFDVLMPYPDVMARDPEKFYRCGSVKPRGRVRARYSEAFAYDPVRQVQHVTMVFEPVDGSPGTVVELSQRQFFPMELEALLSQAGFAIEARYGDFDRRAFDEDADAQVLVTRARARRSST